MTPRRQAPTGVGRLRRSASIPLVVLVLVGCTSREVVLGEGDDVDVCQGMAELDAFPEPAPDRPDAIAGYAHGLVRLFRRIQPDLRVETDDGSFIPPAEVGERLRLMNDRAVSLRRSVDAARGRPDRTRAELSSFNEDPAYIAADSALVAWARSACPD